MDQTRHFFAYFRHFHNPITNIELYWTVKQKIIDGVLGMWTWGSRIVGAGESTELWRPPHTFFRRTKSSQIFLNLLSLGMEIVLGFWV